MQIKNEELLRTYAPAAFADSAETDKVSDRYNFLSTLDILEILQEEGWEAWKAQQVNPRKWSRDHAKHIIRLRHNDLSPQAFNVGDSFPEMLLINGHNGLSSYTLRGGIFRMICSNGMVISEADFGWVSERHISLDIEALKEASRELVAKAAPLAQTITSWQTLELSPRAKTDFFTDAAKLRFDEPDEGIIRDVATPRRVEDNGNDLWRTFNVAQENLLRGGFLNGTTRRRVRAITSITKDVSLNSQLWELADSYATSIA